MKKILLLCLAGSILILSACKKEKDEGAPVVTIIGKLSNRVLAPKTFTDPGATAIDDVDGDISSKVVAHSSIDYNNPNKTYDIYYTATDAAGNEGSSGQRMVSIIDLSMQFEGNKNGNLTYWDQLQFIIADSLKFTKFAGFVDAKVSGFMPSDSTLTIPQQTVSCKTDSSGSAYINRTFSGTGTLNYAASGPSMRTTVTINFTMVESGNTTTGTITYKN